MFYIYVDTGDILTGRSRIYRAWSQAEADKIYQSAIRQGFTAEIRNA